MAIKFVPDKFCTTELCTQAILSNCFAIQYIPVWRRNMEICKIAVKSNGLLLEYVPNGLIHTQEIYKMAVKSNALAIEFVPNYMRTKKLCAIAIFNTPNKYIDRMEMTCQIK